MNELGISSLYPTARGCIDVIGKDAHGHRDADMFRREKSQLVFPIETSRRNPRVGQPVERDVVEDVVARQALMLTVKDASIKCVTARASWSSIQAARPTGESSIPYSVCGRFPISWA